MSAARKPARQSFQQPSRKRRPGPPEHPRSGSRGAQEAAATGLEESAHLPLDPLAVRAALAAAGLLGARPNDADLPTDPAEIAALERDDEAWLLATFTQPLGLGDAVIEDRR